MKGGADGTAVAADEEEAAFGRRAVNWEKKKKNTCQNTFFCGCF